MKFMLNALTNRVNRTGGSLPVTKPGFRRAFGSTKPLPCRILVEQCWFAISIEYSKALICLAFYSVIEDEPMTSPGRRAPASPV